jgi:5'-methylthioadenosine phosphorylase
MTMIAVIGGSGLYDFLDDAEEVDAETPYGQPSAPVTVGRLDGRQVAFLPRHGRRHEFAPHTINYRANMWALRAVGARRVIAPCAVGSLQPDLGPGDLVVPDQLVDRTSGRAQTYMDAGAAHVPFADPYCPDLRRALLAPGLARDGGTMVVIEGPRFSTRAESQWYAGFGWSLINMTGQPEAVLARELALCYAPLALVTDRDAGLQIGEAVTQEEVFAVFREHLETVRRLVRSVIVSLPKDTTCGCGHSLDGIDLAFELP